MKDINFRRIENSDVSSVINLLKQLSSFTPLIKPEELWENFLKSNSIGIVGELRQTSQIIAFGHIIYFEKFQSGLVGLIEDVVVDLKFRKQGVGRLLILELENNARENEAYKLILNTSESNLGFYRNSGFSSQELSLKKFI